MLFYWYQMFCGFSAQLPVGELYQQVQTVLLTSITPVILGIFDQVLIASILYNNPSLYRCEHHLHLHDYCYYQST